MVTQGSSSISLRLQLIIVSLVSLIFPCLGIAATGSVATWAKVYQGWGYAVQQTADGGYVAAGTTRSYSAYIHNMWVVKVDGSGNIEWEKSYGENIGGFAYSIEQTADGGYILGGYTKVSVTGFYTATAARLDKDGNVLWQKFYPNTGQISSIREVPAGGFIAFTSYSVVLRLNADGNITWARKYPFSHDEIASVRNTTDGGFVITGSSNDYSGWLSILKLNADGTFAWQKKYTNITSLKDVLQTKDGGYVVSGQSVARSATRYHVNFCVIKLDQEGNIEWSKNYGTDADETGWSIDQTSDGGYVVTGTASVPYGESGSTVFKLDPNGAIQWQKFFGAFTGWGGAMLLGVQQTNDGGYILSGTPSLVKLTPDGTLVWGECSSIIMRDYNMQAEDASIVTTNKQAWTQTVNITAETVTAIVTDLHVAPRILCEAAAEPDIVLDPTSLDFGLIEFPGPSSMKTVTISNAIANTTLTISSIAVAGTNAGDFTQTNNCSAVVGNSSCTTAVTFAPGSRGARTAILKITSNDPDTPVVEVPLSGAGTDTVPPSTIKTVSGRAGSNDWYVSDVTVILNATDSGSGVKEIHYTVDGTDTIVSGNTASFTISAEGGHNITYYAIDNAGNSETSHFFTVMIDKTLPVITARQTPPANTKGWNNTDVFIEFVCSDAVSGTASCTSPLTISSEGVGQVVTGTVVDNAGNTASISVTVNIDKTAPMLNVSASPDLLWPPNHKMVLVNPTAAVSDANAGATIRLVSVASSEPDNGSGDGDTANDIVINGDGTISLRAERSGAGNGRVYTITYQATDIAGNTATASATVMVPHDL